LEEEGRMKRRKVEVGWKGHDLRNLEVAPP